MEQAIKIKKLKIVFTILPPSANYYIRSLGILLVDPPTLIISNGWCSAKPFLPSHSDKIIFPSSNNFECFLDIFLRAYSTNSGIWSTP